MGENTLYTEEQLNAVIHLHDKEFFKLLNTFLLSIVAWGLCAGAYCQFIEYNFCFFGK